MRPTNRCLRGRAVSCTVTSVLEQRFPETRDAEPELLAHHYAASGNLESAARCWLEAGRNNIRLFANEQAIRYFERALAAIMQLPSNEQIERLELAIQQGYLPALMVVVGMRADKTFKASNRALKLSEKFGIGSTATTVPVLFSQFSYQMASGSLSSALSFASQLAQLGLKAKDSVARLVGQRALGLCHLWMGHLELAQNELEAALSLGERVDHQQLAFELGHDPFVTTQTF